MSSHEDGNEDGQGDGWRNTVYNQLPTAILLSGLLQSFMIGFVMGQAAKYIADYRDDTWKKRAFVFFIVVFSTLQTALEDYKLYYIAIEQKNWATRVILWLNVFVAGVISSACECFFLVRCWRLTGRKSWFLYPSSILLATLVIASLIFAVTVSITVHMVGPQGKVKDGVGRVYFRLSFVAFSYWLFGSIVLDLLLAVISVISLWRAKTGTRESDRVIMKIITMTCESAALPAISMILAAAFFHNDISGSDHKENLVLLLAHLSAKMYAYGVLRTLNSRDRLRKRLSSQDLGRVSLGGWTWTQAGQQQSIAYNTAPPEFPRVLTGTGIIRFEDGTKRPAESCLPCADTVSLNEDVAIEPIPTFVSGRNISELQFSSPRMDARERGLANRSTIELEN